MRYLLTKNEIAMYRKLAGPGVPPQRKSETVFNCKAICYHGAVYTLCSFTVGVILAVQQTRCECLGQVHDGGLHGDALPH